MTLIDKLDITITRWEDSNIVRGIEIAGGEPDACGHRYLTSVYQQTYGGGYQICTNYSDFLEQRSTLEQAYGVALKLAVNLARDTPSTPTPPTPTKPTGPLAHPRRIKMSEFRTEEFTFTRAFSLDEGTGHKLNVSVTHTTATGKFESVSFVDPDSNNFVSVPADLWDRVVAAVERQREF